MALIDLSALISNASGTVAGVTVSKVNAGLVIKQASFPGSVNRKERTQAQINQSAYLPPILALWQSLSDYQRSAWYNLGKKIKKTNSVGLKYNPSGYSLFISNNLNLALISAPRLSDPQPRQTLQQLLSFSTVLQFSVGYNINITFTGITTNQFSTHLIYATPGLSPGISFCKNQYRLIGSIPPLTANVYDCYNDYLSYFSFPSSGSKLFIKLVPVDSRTGFTGIPIFSTVIRP